jgi:NhaP-type Na+/H+ and K+/H+ antiporter
MPQRPSWFIRLLMTTSRIVLLTIMSMALGMGLGLLAGIFGTIIASMIRHTNADMTAAYRTFAIPSALLFGSVTLGYQLVREIGGAVRART